MASEEERWQGREVVDRADERIGTVEAIYLDRASGRPEWALVDVGAGGSGPTFVPVADASLAGEDVCVPFAKSRIESAPAVETRDELSPEEERRLFEHYGMPVPDADAESGATDEASAASATGPVTPPSDDDDDAMTRSEEELHVSTERRPAERVRLRKHVVTEYVRRTVPVRREELRLEREAITGQNAEGTGESPELSEEEHEMILYAEEIVIERRVVPKERVRVSKEVVTEEREVSEQIRKERIETDGIDEPTR